MPSGFAEVYQEHVSPVWRYVRLRVPSDTDAEDVTSEVFARAVRSWPEYDASRGRVGAWLTGIARHTVADWWRKHGREVPVAEVYDGPATDAEDPEGVALRRDGADRLRQHLGLLSPREREAVALRFGGELTSPEIGELLGISPTAARMLVHRAVTRLREVMVDD